MLRRERPKTDPTKILKHSQIVRKAEIAEAQLVGTREKTDYGFTIAGTSTKSFETFHAIVLGGCSTPLWFHAKKSRVFRVTGGSGYFNTKLEDNAVVAVAITVGDELVAAPGVPYCFAAASKLEMYVAQDVKYLANLEELEPVAVVAEVSSEDLRAVTSEDRFSFGPVRRPRSNKAAQQLAEMRGEKLPPSKSENRMSEEDFFRGVSTVGFNAMPVSLGE